MMTALPVLLIALTSCKIMTDLRTTVGGGDAQVSPKPSTQTSSEPSGSTSPSAPLSSASPGPTSCGIAIPDGLMKYGTITEFKTVTITPPAQYQTTPVPDCFVVNYVKDTISNVVWSRLSFVGVNRASLANLNSQPHVTIASMYWNGDSKTPSAPEKNPLDVPEATRNFFVNLGTGNNPHPAPSGFTPFIEAGVTDASKLVGVTTFNVAMLADAYLTQSGLAIANSATVTLDANFAVQKIAFNLLLKRLLISTITIQATITP